MLSAFILGQTNALVDYVQRSCGGDSNISLYQVLSEYPNRHHLVRLLNAYSPKVIFLEIDAGNVALGMARDIHAASPETSLIGFSHKLAFEQLQRVTAAGIPEVLQGYFTIDALHRALARAIETAGLRQGHNTIAFVSAKGGSGATTVAMNMAGVMAKQFKKTALLVEADLHSGPLSVLLDLNPEQSIAEALASSQSVDDALWNSFVSRAQGIDILPAPRDGRLGDFTAWDCQRLLSFVATRYDTVIVDLPDAVSELTAPVVSRADHVYVVCTAEMASLFMAQRRLMEFESMGVASDRVGVVVNRHSEHDVQVSEIESYLETPVCLVLPQDSAAVRQATLGHSLIDGNSAIGAQVSQFAAQIAGVDAEEKPVARASLMRNVLGVFDRRLGKAHT